MTTLPISIGWLVNLEELYLSNNKLTNLPETISDLRSLNLLRINDNQIEYLPESIGYMYSLENLSASRNGLLELPESITELENLYVLILTENKISVLPDNIGIDFFTSTQR